MRIEIFVVMNKINENSSDFSNLVSLETLKFNIVREFGGLTETDVEKGYWHINGQILCDSVKRWIIYADKTHKPSKIHQIGLSGLIRVNSTETAKIFEAINKQIKNLTHQSSQCYGIDGKMFSV